MAGSTRAFTPLQVERWLLSRRVPGVYQSPDLDDSVDLRLQVLGLVVPPDCVVTGGWYYLDIGLPEDRFGVEYVGEEFHGDVRVTRP